MKKLLFLFILCMGLSVFATAQDYEDIVECVLSDVPRLAVFHPKGDYCYGTTRFGGMIEVFDVSDVFSLTSFTSKSALSTVTLSATGYSQAVNGDYYYTTGSVDGSVVDISNPAAPVQIGVFTTMYRCVNLVIAGNYMVGVEYTYNAPNNNAVEVWDISNPAAPVSISSVTLAEEGWSVAVYGDYIYAASDFTAGNETLNIIDFKDPTNISLIKTMSLPGLPYHMAIVDDKLVLSETSVLRLYDLTDPLNPTLLDAETVTGRVCAEDNLNVINNGQVHKVDGTDLKFVQNFDTHGSAQSDGFPFGSDVVYKGTDGMIALAQQARVLILRTLVPPEPLTVDITQIKESIGGVANFTLDAQNTYAGRNYLLMGSVTGTTPGSTLPGGMVLPLNWDIFTNLVLSFVNTPIFDQFMGTLDAAGQASAKFDTLGPIPGTAGLKLFFAYTLGPPPGYDFVSNYVEIEVVL